MKSNIIWLNRFHVKKMLDEAFLWYPKESGGILTGCHDRRNDLLVYEVTTSGPNAIHTNFGYTPDYRHDEKKIAEIYRKSKKHMVYLGDWHTHPKSNAYMSDRDLETLEVISDFKEARVPMPIMVILGTAPFEIKAWQLVKKTSFAVEVNVY